MSPAGTPIPSPNGPPRSVSRPMGAPTLWRRSPGCRRSALQLRLLQTVVEVAAEKNSTLVLPFPVELLRFLERATPSETTGPMPPGAPARPNGAVPADRATHHAAPNAAVVAHAVAER